MKKPYDVKYTGQKFYNKWLYKVTVLIKGVSLLRTKTYDEIREFCLNPEEQDRHYYFDSRKQAFSNKDQILELVTFLEKNKNVEFTKRIESRYIDIYTNDATFCKNLALEFKDYVRHVFEPFPGQEQEQTNSNSIFAKKLPHNRYNYKVYLLPHKLKGNKEAKESFVSWIETQGEKIRMSTAVKSWFIKTDYNWDRRYVLVEDEKTLFMMQLRNGEVVGRVYDYQILAK
jgi:hypothetical protein